MATSSQSTRKRLLQLLQHFQATQPNTPVSLSELAQILGVSRERVRQLYQILAAHNQLPPVDKAGFWNEKRKLGYKDQKLIFEQKVKLLREQGMTIAQIGRELGVSRQKVANTISLLIGRGEIAPKLETITFLIRHGKIAPKLDYS